MDTGLKIKTRAHELGAVAAGICPVSALPQNRASIEGILPHGTSVICIAVPHSRTCLTSEDPYVKQYDTIFCYQEVARISHYLVRYLEDAGYQAVAVPAFLPLDMSDGKMGMIGALDWKLAAVESGVAVWGRSGLALSPVYGARIRIGGLITTAEIQPDKKLDFAPCGSCRLCVDSCPAGALLGDGKIDRKLCGEQVFTYGLRAFTRVLADIASASNEARVKELVYSRRTRELWQALETGNYYSCWICQSICPSGKDGK